MQRGGRQERVLTSSSDDDSCQMYEGHLNFTWMAWMITTWWKRCYEGLRGARFVSPLFCNFTGRCGVGWFCVCLFVCLLCFGLFVVCVVWFCQ